MSDDSKDIKDWAAQYSRVRQENDRATRWAGGVGQKFPMQPEALHPTTMPTLQSSQFGPTTEGLVQRGATADSERYDYHANPGNRITRHSLDMKQQAHDEWYGAYSADSPREFSTPDEEYAWRDSMDSRRVDADARYREGKATASEYDTDRNRKIRAGESAHNLSTMAMQDSHGEGAPDSMLGQVREASSRLREFSHFDKSSPPGGASGAILASIFVGQEGLQHGGTRGASDLLREAGREVWRNPLRHGRN